MNIKYLKQFTRSEIRHKLLSMKCKFFQCFFSGDYYWKNSKNGDFVKVTDNYVMQLAMKLEICGTKVSKQDTWQVIKLLAGEVEKINPRLDNTLNLDPKLAHIDPSKELKNQLPGLSNKERSFIIMLFWSIQHYLETKECDLIFITSSKLIWDFLQKEFPDFGNVSRYNLKQHESKDFGNVISFAENISPDLICKSKNLIVSSTKNDIGYYDDDPRVIELNIMMIVDPYLLGGVIKSLMSKYTTAIYANSLAKVLGRNTKNQDALIRDCIATDLGSTITVDRITSSLRMKDTRSNQMKVGAILKDMSYTKTRQYAYGKRQNVYCKAVGI